MARNGEKRRETARNGEKRRETAIQFKDKKNHYNKRAG